MACTPERSAALGDLAAGRPDATALDELLDHLEACAACSAELELVAELVARADEGAEGSRGATQPRGALRRGPWAVAAATAAAALILAWFTLRTGPIGPATVESLADLRSAPVGAQVLRGVEERGAAFVAALEHLAAGEARAASTRLEEHLAERPDDALAALYLGRARIADDRLDAALEALDVAAAGGEGLVLEEALWLAANVHLARGDGAGARTTLRRLSDLNGDYRLNAEALLAELRTIVER